MKVNRWQNTELGAYIAPSGLSYMTTTDMPSDHVFVEHWFTAFDDYEVGIGLAMYKMNLGNYKTTYQVTPVVKHPNFFRAYITEEGIQQVVGGGTTDGSKTVIFDESTIPTNILEQSRFAQLYLAVRSATPKNTRLDMPSNALELINNVIWGKLNKSFLYSTLPLVNFIKDPTIYNSFMQALQDYGFERTDFILGDRTEQHLGGYHWTRSSAFRGADEYFGYTPGLTNVEPNSFMAKPYCDYFPLLGVGINFWDVLNDFFPNTYGTNHLGKLLSMYPLKGFMINSDNIVGYQFGLWYNNNVRGLYCSPWETAMNTLTSIRKPNYLRNPYVYKDINNFLTPVTREDEFGYYRQNLGATLASRRTIDPLTPFVPGEYNGNLGVYYEPIKLYDWREYA